MQIELLPSCLGDRGNAASQFLTSFFINEDVAIDVGSLGFFHDVERQKKIKNIFLTHTHQDHIASLPAFMDNVFTPDLECTTIFCSQSDHQTLTKDVFNDRVWPDFIRLGSEDVQFMNFKIIDDGDIIELDGLRFTAIKVNHLVPTFSYIIEEVHSDKCIAIISDTGPTDEIWKQLNSKKNIDALFVESAFPNSMEWLAKNAFHLTPKMLENELSKLDKIPPVYAIHLKPSHRAQIIEEINDLNTENIKICEPGISYTF